MKKFYLIFLFLIFFLTIESFSKIIKINKYLLYKNRINLISINSKKIIKNYKYHLKIDLKKYLFKKLPLQYAQGVYTIKNRHIIKIKSPIGYKEIGFASYYDSKFKGLKTSNGESFNLNALTAAHKTLPFNTLVKVTNLKTRRSIIVRINDRGPFVRGRIIDLTPKAAKKLGIYKKGVAKVKIEVIS